MLSFRAAVLAWFFFGQLAFAHAPGLSSAEIIVAGEKTLVNLTFAIQDIESILPMDKDLEPDYNPGHREVLLG